MQLRTDYPPFRAEDYVSNPIALARLEARQTRAKLAGRMGVSQANISKIEGQSKVPAKLLENTQRALPRVSAARKRARA